MAVLNFPPFPVSVPPALRTATPVFKELLRRYAALPMEEMLNRHCPDPGRGAASSSSSSSEHASKRARLADGGASSSSSFAAAGVSAKDPSTAPMLSLATPLQPGVMGFVREVLGRLLPPPLWGGAANRRALLSAAHATLSCGKGQSPRVCDITRGLRTTAYPIFASGGTDSGSQALYAQAWVLWVLLALVLPLVRASFHVTDGEVAQCRLMYFRKRVWWRACCGSTGALVRRLGLAPVGQGGVGMPLGPLGYSSVRFVPKAVGLRPIMNLAARHTGWPLTLAASEARARGRGEGAGHKRPLQAEAALSSSSSSSSSSAAVAAAAAAPAAALPLSRAGSLAPPSARPPPTSSINFQLTALHEVLKFERKRTPASSGGSVYGLDGVHSALRLFHALRSRGSGSSSGSTPPPLRPLHIVTADVNAAYDNIEQDRVLDTVLPLLREEEYTIRAYTVVTPLRGYKAAAPGAPSALHPAPLSQRRRRAAFSQAQLPSFPELAEQLAGSSRRAVVCDAVLTDTVPSGLLRELLGAHVKGNLVGLRWPLRGAAGAGTATGTTPREVLALQGRGLPQGSIVSSALCNLYLAAMESSLIIPRASHALHIPCTPGLTGLSGVPAGAAAGGSSSSSSSSSAAPFPPTSTTGCSLLMRLTDDFLFASECRASAEALARAAHEGAPHLGVAMNLHKTQTTLQLLDLKAEDGRAVTLGAAQPPGAPIPWCGLSLHPASGSVTASYGRYMRGGGVAGSLPVAFPPHSGAGLAAAIKVFLRPKCQAVLLDGVLSPLPVVAGSLWDMCTVAAAKGLVLLRRARARGEPVRPATLLAAVTHAVDYFVALVAVRAPAGSREAALAGAPGVGLVGQAQAPPRWLQPPFPPTGQGLVVLGPACVTSLAVLSGTGSSVAAVVAGGGEGRAGPAPRPMAWCPLFSEQVRWVALGAFARVLQDAPRLAQGVAGQLRGLQEGLRRDSRLSHRRWAGVEEGVGRSTLLKELRAAARAKG